MWCSSTRTSTNPCARQASANVSACSGVQPWLWSPWAPGSVALAGEEPTAGTEHPAGLGQADEEIRRLTDARTYLAGALLCRYDHPATDCQIMGAEIDRRLSSS